MSDQLSVNRVGTVPGQEYNYQVAQAAQQNAAAATTIKNVEQSDKKSEAKKDKPEEERNEEQQADFRKILKNVEMDFDVDPETNEITLTILDKETKEILRTIPERAWDELSVAELFRVTA